MQSSFAADTNNLRLKDIRIFSFDSKGNRLSVTAPNISIWIAVSCVELTCFEESIADNQSYQSKPCIGSKRSVNPQLQKQAVRQLLYSVVSRLLEHCQFYYVEPKIINLLSTCGLNLQQSSYPYRLMPFNYYVCFTHSADTVACAIHKHRPIGIDIENHSVSLSVAQRFFNKQEMQWLSSLDAEVQPQALNLLWMLKEAVIKIDFSDNNHLLAGLKVNMLLPARQLLQIDGNNTETEAYSGESKLWGNNDSEINSKIEVVAFKKHIYLQLLDKNLVAVW